jgi:predicted enzyme related to lactoylglutathione lyase
MEQRFFSQITFLYYNDLEAGASFYQNVLGLPIIEDQGFAKIFQVREHAYIGVVDGKKGYHRAQEKSAVMVTLCVKNVQDFYEDFKKQGVKILSQPEMDADLQIMSFFFEDPGGYTLEIQRFYNPRLETFFQS